MTDPRTIELAPGHSLHAVTGGKGRDILLLHGALATHRDWFGGPFEALAELGRVTAIDRPGHGLSRRPRFKGSPRQQARQVRDALAALEVERPLIVGHSLGGLVALALAEMFPDDVSGLLLLAPIVFPEIRPLEQGLYGARSVPITGPAIASLMTGWLDRPLVEMAHQLMFAPDSPPAYWKRGYPWDDVLSTGQSVAEGEDSAAVHPLAAAAWIDFARITIPVQVVAGAGDKIVDPARHARPLADALPDARLAMIDGAGHMLHHSRREVVVDYAREALALV